MPSLRGSGLLPNEDWPALVDQLLRHGTEAAVAARSTLWSQLYRYLEHTRLPIGPLADDPDVRRDLAVKLMERLEENDFRHLHHWRRAQRQKPRASWWPWIHTIVQRMAIDAARASKRNLDRRGNPHQWARPVSLSSGALDAAQTEAFHKRLQFIACARHEDLVRFLSGLQELLLDAAEDAPDVDEPERTPTPPATPAPQLGNGAKDP